MDSLYAAARSNDVGAMIVSLKRLVPEFKPAYSFSGEAPVAFRRVRPDLFPPQIVEKAKILPLRK
jgi:hypothetical protein